MTRAPFVMAKPAAGFPRGKIEMEDSTIGWRFVNPRMAERYEPVSLGETAENVAERHDIGRLRQDEFALASQHKAVAAISEGHFGTRSFPFPSPNRVERSQEVRYRRASAGGHLDGGTRKLAPRSKRRNRHRGQLGPGSNDGAAALLIMSEEKARELGLKPLAKYVASTSAGVSPLFMGIDRCRSTQKLFARTGLSADNLDLIELNEAFAAQSLACIDELGLPMDRINVNGGAIALGHPLGCSGAKLTTTLVHEMQRRDARYGLVSMCVGVGQGVSSLFERVP